MTSDLFEAELTAPVYRSRDFFSESDWVDLRDSGSLPTFVTDQVTSERDRKEFLKGAELLALYGEGAGAGRELTPQMLAVCDMLAAGKRRNGLLMPRRSGKTTALICVALGRAYYRQGYRVAIYTMTTGKAGRSRFKRDVVPYLDANFPAADKKNWPYKIVQSPGFEAVEFKESKGMVVWISSIADFRGEAFDFVILDEAGEAMEDKVKLTMSAASPTMTNRKKLTGFDPQLCIAGTGGKYRAGNLLWSAIHPDETGAALAYMLDQDNHTDEELEDWDYISPLIEEMHPGVGNLTNMEEMRGEWNELGPADFVREYGGIFSQLGGGKFVNPVRWSLCAAEGDPEFPEHFAISVAVDPEGRSAAIGAAWRDEEGNSHGVITEHKKGTAWLVAELQRIQRKHPTKPIYFDEFSNAKDEVDQFKKRTKNARTAGLKWADISDGSVRLKKDIDEARFRHYNQPSLSNTASFVTKRGTKDSRRWSWGRTKVEGEWDITPFEAVSNALRAFDAKPARTTLPPMSLDEFDE